GRPESGRPVRRRSVLRRSGPSPAARGGRAAPGGAPRTRAAGWVECSCAADPPSCDRFVPSVLVTAVQRSRGAPAPPPRRPDAEAPAAQPAAPPRRRRGRTTAPILAVRRHRAGTPPADAP